MLWLTHLILILCVECSNAHPAWRVELGNVGTAPSKWDSMDSEVHLLGFSQVVLFVFPNWFSGTSAK